MASESIIRTRHEKLYKISDLTERDDLTYDLTAVDCVTGETEQITVTRHGFEDIHPCCRIFCFLAEVHGRPVRIRLDVDMKDGTIWSMD
ncbi:hypothetical protein FJZ39_04285 [Candidatus Saccharibacteria bacterium]|nr:hypothetical protein [Candidatus Saccharibacteria bacterium]